MANGVVAVLGVPERQLLVYLVSVAAPVAALAQVAGMPEVVDDLGCGAFGDADPLGDVPEADGWFGGDDLEDVGVVGYKPERMILLTGT